MPDLAAAWRVLEDSDPVASAEEVEAAIAKGVFGSPYIVVDGEPFWGMDRFDQLERWLKAPF